VLSDEQLNIILKKDFLEFSDIYMLEDHIAYIGNLQDEYGDNLDYDVAMNLKNDLHKIIDKLEEMREKLKEMSFGK
jgi:hypothetical protein